MRHLADAARGFQPVHLRHLHVHQDQVVAVLCGQGLGFKAVTGHVHLQPGHLQQGAGDFAVHRLVLGQQHAATTVQFLQLPLGLPGQAARTIGRAAAALQTGRQPEGAALAGRADHATVTPHQLRQAAVDGQAQARAAILPRDGVVALLEHRKQARLDLRRNADAGVLHFQPQQQAFGRFFFGFGAQRDGA